MIKPDEQIPDLGRANEPVSIVTTADLSGISLSAEDAFVLSRIDGRASTHLLCQLSGLGTKRTIQILTRLRSEGLIIVGNEKPQQPKRKPPEPVPSKPVVAVGLALHVEAHELAMDDASIDLSLDEKKLILGYHKVLGTVDLFTLLEVPYDAPLKVIRRSYFAKSKQFHPDRFYTRNLGRYKEMLAAIFKQLSMAYQVLEDDAQRASYLQLLRQGGGQSAPKQEPSPKAASKPVVTSVVLPEPLTKPPPIKPAPQPVSKPVSRERGIASEAYESHPDEDDSLGSYSFVAKRRRHERETRDGMKAIASPEKDETRNVIDATPTPESGAPETPDLTLPPPAPERPPRRDDPKAHRTVSSDDETEQDTDDPAEKERRERDRHRRKQLTTSMQPVLVKKKRAQEFYEQGVAQLEAGKALAASASLKLATTYDPDNRDYAAKYEEALRQSRSVTAENYFKRAIFEESVGRYEAAMELYVKAADLSEHEVYLQKAAFFCLTFGELLKAKDYATKAVQVAPNSVEARVVLARAYHAAELKKNALREIEIALKLKPDHQEASELLREIKRN